MSVTDEVSHPEMSLEKLEEDSNIEPMYVTDDAGMPGKEPIKQRRPYTPDMQKTGRAGGETGSNGHWVISTFINHWRTGIVTC